MSPSVCSCLKVSRTGVRLTPNSSARASSEMLTPGWISPAMMRRRISVISLPWIEPLSEPFLLLTVVLLRSRPGPASSERGESAAVEEFTGAVDHGMPVTNRGVHDAADEHRMRAGLQPLADLDFHLGGAAADQRTAERSGLPVEPCELVLGLDGERVDDVDLVDRKNVDREVGGPVEAIKR